MGNNKAQCVPSVSISYMLRNISLKKKLIFSSIGLVVLTVLFIGGFSLQQLTSFSDSTISQAYDSLIEQGLANMKTGVEMDRFKIETLISTAENSAKRLAASANMREYLSAEATASQIARNEAEQIVEGLIETCKVQQNLLQTKVTESLSIAEYVMNSYGTPSLSQESMTKWTVVNQFTNERSTRILPEFLLGDTGMDRQYTFRLKSPVVDDVQDLMHVTCTIFQRMNKKGDLLRIATNVEKEDGNRAIGTYIPALNPDGTPNRVVSTVLDGETFEGRAFVVNAWYITAYKAIVDNVKNVIGALYVGVPLRNEAIEKAVIQTKVGQSGHSFVLDFTGTVLIHSDPSMIGVNMITDAGIRVFEDIITEKDANTVKTTSYSDTSKKTFISYSYFPAWDWIICASYDWDDIVPQAVRRATAVLKNEIETVYDTATMLIDGEERPLFTHIGFVSEQGQELLNLHSGTFAAPESIHAEAPWYQEALALNEGEVYTSGVSQSPTTEKTELHVATPVFFEDDLKGLLIVSLDWTLVWSRLKDSVYGETGYAFMLNEQGQVISHPDYQFADQVNLTDPQFGALSDIVTQRMLQGEAGHGRYTVDETDRFIYFVPLRIEEKIYFVAATTPVEEFLSLANSIKRSSEDNFRQAAAIIGLVIGIGILLALTFGLRISRSIIGAVGRAVNYAQHVSEGDLSTTLAVKGDDEINKLLSAINEMVHSLKKVISQIQQTAIQVMSSSTELSATAKEQETIIAHQVDSTNTVVKSVERISSVAENLVQTMQHVSAMSEDTAEVATNGQNDLRRMEDSMHRMEQASKAISGRLEAINEKTENITTVVTTITRVADQTNLLSLNAAIEAEKAGEYGQGFAVVAREIRRLADQTAMATLDIGQMVQDMQMAVDAGVMEMDKFIAEVRHSAEDIGNISMQMSHIIEKVQDLTPNFEDVNQAMEQQSQDARQINHDMMDLSEEMRETKDSLHETYSAIEQLNQAARNLQEEVSRFHV